MICTRDQSSPSFLRVFTKYPFEAFYRNLLICAERVIFCEAATEISLKARHNVDSITYHLVLLCVFTVELTVLTLGQFALYQLYFYLVVRKANVKNGTIIDQYSWDFFLHFTCNLTYLCPGLWQLKDNLKDCW